MSNSRNGIAVFGGVSLDAHLVGTATNNGSQIIVDSGDVRERFDSVNGLAITNGIKVPVKQNIEEKLQRLQHYSRPGGGGYFSTVTIQELSRGTGTLRYIDATQSHPLFTDEFDALGVDYSFFGLGDAPTSLVIGGRQDKIVLTVAKFEPITLSKVHMASIDEVMSASNAVLLISPKYENLAEQVAQRTQNLDGNFYFVPNVWMSPEFISRIMSGRPTTILNYDEAHHLLHTKPVDDEAIKLEMALELVKKIISEGVNRHGIIFVTLGKYGVLISSNGGVSKVSLNDDYREDVQRSVLSNRGNTTGAGDVFAGAVTYLGTNHPYMSPADIARVASAMAVKHIGYKSDLPLQGFTVRNLNLPNNHYIASG